MPNCQYCGVQRDTESWRSVHENQCSKNPENKERKKVNKKWRVVITACKHDEWGDVENTIPVTMFEIEIPVDYSPHTTFCLPNIISSPVKKKLNPTKKVKATDVTREKSDKILDNSNLKN